MADWILNKWWKKTIYVIGWIEVIVALFMIIVFYIPGLILLVIEAIKG